VDYWGESFLSDYPNGEMKTANLSELAVQLGPSPAMAATPDADLLRRFLADRDEQAFSLIVRRHGPQVLGVCRRVTGDHHLAEDAFQAVFVVLAAKAGSVRPQAALAAWLYGVAYRIALRARTMRDRRLRHEKPVETVPEPATSTVDQAEAADLIPALDEEIARLPEYQRVPVVVCELEGASRQEAAARLGISEGTLSSRLARARKALADRLRRRGIALSVAGLTAAFAQLAPASVPGGLVSAAVASAIGPGLVPAIVATLAHGAIRIMFFQKLKVLSVASGLLVSAVVVSGWLIAATPPASTPAPAASVVLVSHSPNVLALTPAPEKPLPQGPNKILLFRNGYLVLLDPDGSNEKKVIPDRLPFYRDARLSPDGKTVALLSTEVGKPGQPIRLDRPQKLFIRAVDEKGPSTDLGAPCKMFAWSPDGSEIACNWFPERPQEEQTDYPEYVVNVKTRKKTPLKLPDNHFLNDWSRDGKFFLTTDSSTNAKNEPCSRLYLVNRDGTVYKALTDDSQIAIDGRLSPDGTRVLHGLLTFPKEGKGKYELVVLDITSGKSTPVGGLTPNSEVWAFCWSPDGKRIAYVWKERPEGKPEELEKKETQSHLVVCDPDGKNAKTIASETGSSPGVVTIGRVDWR
jgi:RNA polymerase sigma factor (sigma-70 family)